MDPQRAYDVLSLAATKSAPLSTGRVCFFEFNELHSAEVRACKSRTDCLSLAKKYVKAWDAIEDLEKGIEAFPHSARLYRAPQTYNIKGVGKSPDPRVGAIVPFVKTAPVERPLLQVAPKSMSDQPHGAVEILFSAFAACRASRVVKHYGCALKAMFHVAAYLPLFVLMCACAYSVLTALYLAFNPVVLAKLVLLSAKNVVIAGIERVASDLNNVGPSVTDSWIPTWL